MATSKKKQKNIPSTREQQNLPLGSKGRDARRISTRFHPLPLDADKIAKLLSDRVTESQIQKRKGKEGAIHDLDRLIAQEIQVEVDGYYEEQTGKPEVQEVAIAEVEPEAIELFPSEPITLKEKISVFNDYEISLISAERGWHPAVVELYLDTRDSRENVTDQTLRERLFKPEVSGNDMFEAIKLGLKEGWEQFRINNHLYRPSSKEF